MYKIPKEFEFRIHHVRPRFKSELESVLLFFCKSAYQIGSMNSVEFRRTLNEKLRLYPGNSKRTDKTINNWRTEISTLFGFVFDDKKETHVGKIAEFLALNEDIPEMFRYFVYKFQYPGAHIKNERILEQLQKGIMFQPAKYILNVLKVAQVENPGEAFITKEECTHCIFNDLRCTRKNHETYNNTWKRIISNRRMNISYDSKGDVTRYAKDILDYMVIADLLNEVDNKSYYLNLMNESSIEKVSQNTEYFSDYDKFMLKSPTLSEIDEVKIRWFSYVNDISNIRFPTNILAYSSTSTAKYKKYQEKIMSSIRKNTLNNGITTKDIGDHGEGIIYDYEISKLLEASRNDLTHLITFIPTPLAIGFDFNSIEPDTELRRYIDVKTTISTEPLTISSFHMTINEIRAALTIGEHYFIYRLRINKDDSPILTIIKNPLSLVEDLDVTNISNFQKGIDISFNLDEFEEIIL